MGTHIIKRNGLFKLKSSSSDQLLAEDLSEKETKEFLIKREIWKAIDEIIKIEIDFPNGYFINGKKVLPKKEEEHMKGTKWILDNYNSDSIYEKFIEIIKKHKLQEFFEPLVENKWTDQDMLQFHRWAWTHPQGHLMTEKQLLTSFKKLHKEGKFKLTKNGN